jgi:hypothetical protein
MSDLKIKICRIILVLCIIVPILILIVEIISKNNYKAISYSIIPVITGISGLISSYSSREKKE